jgi:hypothetical protein
MVRIPQAPDAQTVLPVPPPLPGWARIDAPLADTGTDAGAAFQAGAALAMLDCRVRADVPFAGVWRRRLALKAAAASARIARRGEDEATLRDVFFLRHGGDDPGPAGRMLVAWRSLDRSAPLSDDAVFHVADILQLKMDDVLRAAIAEVQQLASAEAAPFAAAQAARIVAQQPGAGILALWLADAVLAARLKWPRPLPLIAGALMLRRCEPLLNEDAVPAAARRGAISTSSAMPSQIAVSKQIAGDVESGRKGVGSRLREAPSP